MNNETRAPRETERPTVYLDHMATTPCLAEVVEAMAPYFIERFHNPQSFHPAGKEVLEAVESARQRVADLIGASAREITFTSGATESNNWAIKGIAASPRRKGKHIVTSKIEHYSVLHPLKTLKRAGFEVTHVPVDQYGTVDPDEVRKAIRRDTALVSITHASTEIGTVEPIAEIAKVCREAGALMHVDAACTAGNMPFDVRALGVDMATISPHMFYGPKGVGALYVRRGLKLAPLIEGGTHEDGRRAGTENVPAIVGSGKACEVAKVDMEKRLAHFVLLRDRLRKGLEKMDRVRITGHPTKRLPHHMSCVADFVEGESILLSLIMGSGIYAASGSACTSKALQPSYVLEAIGLDASAGSGSLVFGIGLDNTVEDIEYLLKELPPVIARLRAMSPMAG